MASTPRDESPTRTIGAVENSCRIIECLHALGGARIRELSKHLDISKGAIHTHLATLRENGYVVQDGNKYRTSLRFLEIGEAARNRTEIVQAEKDNLRKLAEETNTRVQLAREEFGMTIVVKIVSSEETVEPSTRIGDREYLHYTAAGKAVLAHLPRDRVEEIVDRHGLPARTRNTITDRETLFEELEEIEERGVAFNDEEKIQGLRAVGAPILTDDGRVLGAVSASAPINEMKTDRFRNELPEQVSRTANAIALNVRIQQDGPRETEFHETGL